MFPEFSSKDVNRDEGGPPNITKLGIFQEFQFSVNCVSKQNIIRN